MNNESCSCVGRCRPAQPSEPTRREFIQTVAAGAAGLAFGTGLVRADNAAKLTVPKLPESWRYPLTPPRVYTGAHLEAVAMPIGGIGTGTIWLDGQGRLSVWQIFNNNDERRVPDGFFAVRVNQGDQPPVVRVLQTVAEEPLAPVQSLSYEGGYPIARLDFSDAALPVAIRLEAFNPMIPTDAANSSIPCAIYRFTVRNTGNSPVELSLIGTCKNATNSGRTRNRVLRERGMVAVAMEQAVPSGRVKVLSRDGAATQERQWLVELPKLTEQSAQPLAQIAETGGVAVAAGVLPAFFTDLAALHSDPALRDFTVFEDFEKGTYDGWTVSGEALGKVPSTGTHPNQQVVSGYAGNRLVNTYLPGDNPQGTLTSRLFTIERRHIGFLIAGGNQPNKVCVNLKVAGEVVRTATGKNLEALEPVAWDVGDLKGREAVIEILDGSSDTWGHINVDQIVFSDVSPELVLRNINSRAVAKALALQPAAADTAHLDAEVLLPGTTEPWRVASYTRLQGFRDGEHGYRTRVAAPNGDPLIIEGPLGQGRVVLALAPNLPWSWTVVLFALRDGESAAPSLGTMSLAALNAAAIGTPRWTKRDEIAAGLPSGMDSGESATGETFNAALSVPLRLAPGEERTETFVMSWHFPNVNRYAGQHAGNYYARRWPDALGVARYVAANAEALWQRTRLYHETLYQSNLPEEFLDAMSSQSVIFRGPTCWQAESGYFGAAEGSYGCCEGSTSHVWNYAQSHARLFPEIGRNMRISGLITYLVNDRFVRTWESVPCGPAVDGNTAAILGALREHQLSPDRSFLEKVWPNVRKVTEWLIEAYDPYHDGLLVGQQSNTYDSSLAGPNTYIGSQYLAALAAAERLALAMNDADSASRWRGIRETGMKNQSDKLWNGEYFIQIADRPRNTPALPPLEAELFQKPNYDYNTGCHADQLLGQWWAHSLDLGYLYPADRVRQAMSAVMKYNFREKFAGFNQSPRRYVPDDEGGLIICTWPHQGRPKPFINYADEAWTGIEYATAGLMVCEGLIDEARRIVKTARGRYDGRLRPEINSGPGGNPFNELECGKFYARAQSSWSLLTASQGLVLDGPSGVIGFKPRWQPADHRSFFTVPEGWGLFIQKRDGSAQHERLELRHGQFRVQELVFELPAAAPAPTATVRIAGRAVEATLHRDGTEVRLKLVNPVTAKEGEAVEVGFSS